MTRGLLILFLSTITLLMPSVGRTATCTVSAQPVSFGHYNPLAAGPRNRTGRITAVCKGNGTLTVSLSTGQSGSYNSRYMISGTTTNQLGYNLYTKAARTIIFGDGTGGTQTVSKNFKNRTVRIRVYGRIPDLQNVAPGNYTDTIIVTVTF